MALNYVYAAVTLGFTPHTSILGAPYIPDAWSYTSLASAGSAAVDYYLASNPSAADSATYDSTLSTTTYSSVGMGPIIDWGSSYLYGGSPYNVYMINVLYTMHGGLNDGLSLNFFIFYAPSFSSYSDGPPPEPPSDFDLQVQLTARSFYNDPTYPEILPKYNNGQPIIRGTYNAGTQTAVIYPRSGGGFLIYEEIADAPSGNILVYDYHRHLVNVVPASQIAQYY